MQSKRFRGFLVDDENSRNAKIAPIYDCGSCLYPQADLNLAQKVLTDKEGLEKRIYIFPTSAIKIDNVKINPYNFLTQTDNKDCLKALKKITQRIDLQKINEIIDNTPIITDIHKDFLKTMVKARKELILETSLVKNKNIAMSGVSLCATNATKEKDDIQNAQKEFSAEQIKALLKITKLKGFTLSLYTKQ